MATSSLPLNGVRVLGMTQAWAGPFATQLLADMGAEVIKVEAATRPDVLRLSMLLGETDTPSYENGPWFHTVNRNTLSISVLIDTQEGRDIFRELAARSDVVLDNFSARVMPNLGFGYDELRMLKPDIIVVSMPAFGRGGPYESFVGYGEMMEAIGGLTALTGYAGEGPLRTGTAIVDALTSLNAAIAVMAALLRRADTGQGQLIDVSHFESCSRVLGEELLAVQRTGAQPPVIGNRDLVRAPQGCYPCTGDDEWLVISVETDEQWAALAHLVGGGDLMGADLATVEGRRRQHDWIDHVLARWSAGLGKYEAMERCQAVGVPAGAVLKASDLVGDPHLIARHFFEETDHPVVGRETLPGLNFKLSKTPGGIRIPAPLFGQHTDEILRSTLGKSDEEIEWLRAQGIVGGLPLIGSPEGTRKVK